MKSELFIFGDPRFLSGGLLGCGHLSKRSTSLPLMGNKTRVTSKYLSSRNPGHLSIEEQVACTGQHVHCGKSGYHDSPPWNFFLEDDQNPTAGIELEMHEKERNPEKIAAALTSNWFHFESDSSLSTNGKAGYELITEPLPPKIYRNPKTWAGLQNILTPWFTSFSSSCTGLHVHVGISQFKECDKMPVGTRHDRVVLGKLAIVALYNILLSRTFVDKVMLRQHTMYCEQSTWNGLDTLQPIMARSVTGHEFFDKLAEAYFTKFGNRTANTASYILNALTCSIPVGGCDDTNVFRSRSDFPSGLTGHHTEINIYNENTIEFRRGKGTLHSMSIHRMIELATLIVRYAWKIARDPDQIIQPNSLYEFIIRSTNSEALRAIAKTYSAKE